MNAKNANGKRHATQQSLNGAIKSICDVMRRSNCAGETVYDPGCGTGGFLAQAFEYMRARQPGAARR